MLSFLLVPVLPRAQYDDPGFPNLSVLRAEIALTLETPLEVADYPVLHGSDILCDRGVGAGAK